MNREPTEQLPSGPDSAVERVIVPRTRDLGDGFEVRRALPVAERRMVGPFIFFDQMGPSLLRPGHGLDVRPHPHIGLATVTYLFEGELLHRDSLGSVQRIRPGEVNWMTAGRGIAHSERTPPELRLGESRLFGVQVWIALPRRLEETEPSFAHHGSGELPLLEGEGKRLRLVVGTFAGARSPVRAHSDMFYADLAMDAGAALSLGPEHEERAVYVLDGQVDLGPEGGTFGAGQLVVLRPRVSVTLRALATAPAQVLLLGGATLDGKRHIWWNFVSSSHERIEQAKADWREGRFHPIPGETEFIPLPETEPPPVRYP